MRSWEVDCQTVVLLPMFQRRCYENHHSVPARLVAEAKGLPLPLWALPRARTKELYEALENQVYPGDMIHRWNDVVWPDRYREVLIRHEWEREFFPLVPTMKEPAPKLFFTYFHTLIGLTNLKLKDKSAPDTPPFPPLRDSILASERGTNAAMVCRLKALVTFLYRTCHDGSYLEYEVLRVKSVLMAVSPMTAEYVSPEVLLVKRLIEKVGYTLHG